MRKVSLRRGPKTGAPRTRRQRRQRTVSRLTYAFGVGVLVWTVWREGWGAAAWFVGMLVVLFVVLIGIEMYVSWPERPGRRNAPPIQDWAVTDTDPDARVYRGHPSFFYETKDEAHARRISGVPDTKVRPRQPDAVRMQRRGRKSLFRTKRRPYETEMEAAMEKMLERRRGELETCESPAVLITSVLVEAMGGDEPADEVRDWFVATVLARVESDRYWARLPPLEQARAEFRGRSA